MKSVFIRKRFLDFFVKQGHALIPSCSVIPSGYYPPGTYFVNSGISQFRDDILTNHLDSYPKRIVNCQKCVRLGGQKCDLSLIGKDSTHLSFFEMLGTWSFGDYNLYDAVKMALEFLKQEMKLSIDQLHAYYFRDESQEDEQALRILKSLNIKNIRPCKDAVWTMDESGPQGKCIEFYYPVNGELIELWNIVNIKNSETNHDFIIDTGMGLERLAMILQGKHSVFETDLFQPIVEKIYQLSNSKEDVYQVADHARTIAICMSDSLRPDSIGLGRILRQLIERSIDIACEKWNITSPFLFKILDTINLPYDNLSNSDVKDFMRSMEQRYFEKRRKSRIAVQQYISTFNKKIIGEEDLLGIEQSMKLACENKGVQLSVEKWPKGESLKIEHSNEPARLPSEIFCLLKNALLTVDALLVSVRKDGNFYRAKVAKLRPFDDIELDRISKYLRRGFPTNIKPLDDGLFSLLFAFDETLKTAIQYGIISRNQWNCLDNDGWDKYKLWHSIKDDLDNGTIKWSQSETALFIKNKPSDQSAKRAVSNRLRRNSYSIIDEIPTVILIGALHMLKIKEPTEVFINNRKTVVYPSKQENKPIEAGQWISDRIVIVDKC